MTDVRPSHTPAYGGVDLTTCDREPIHVPGAIQPHGVLLALEPDDLTAVVVSANCEQLLGVASGAARGRTLAELLGDAAAAAIAPRAASPTKGEPMVLRLPEDLPLATGARGALAGADVDVTVHRSGERVVVELEQLGGPGAGTLSYQSARGAMARLASAGSVADLADRLAHEVRGLSGFDRVMVYRFDQDWNGEVIAEDRREDLNPFLGLHYPATDIPAQARRLYTVNWTRLIADVSYTPVPLDPVLDEVTGAPLDLSHSTLRSVSPIHVEYLTNMGVGASMSVSLVIDDELWGLVACHHYSGPHRPSHDARAAVEFLGQVASQMINDRERADGREAAIGSQTELNRFTAALTASELNPLVQLMSDPALLRLVGAGGAALSVEGVITTLGRVPEERHLQRIGALLHRPDGRAVHTHHLGVLAPDLEEVSDVAAGAMVIGSSDPSSWLMWLRPELEEVVDWGGDPTNKLLYDAEGPEVRLSPRKSFDKWRQVVRGRSEPWTAWQVDTAEALNAHVTGVLLARSREQIAMAESLQRSVVAEVAPDFDGVEIAARYLPASTYQLGGDWWDAFELDDGRVAFVVGDVAGHGVQAATAMTQVRTALRAYLFGGDTPAGCLDRLDRLMDGLLDQRVATALVGVLDRASGVLQLSSAGHLPPLLCVDGEAHELSLRQRPLLGIGVGQAVVDEVDLSGGATVLMYTDGLVERRGLDIAETLEQLRVTACVGPGERMQEWVDEIVEAVGGVKDDDTTVLAIRMGPQG